jgi:hypothetical protein
MHNQREDILSPTEPALIVRYGNTTRKHIRLDRDVVLIGRARTCDVALVSPEVAPVHCVIVRSGSTWHLRDLTARGATRVNGKSVTAEVLGDGDVVQVGAFSFEAQLPAATRGAGPAPGAGPVFAPSLPQIQRLQRSRRRLIRLALRLRQRARQTGPLPPSLAELERQASALRSLHRQCEEQLRELEEAEAELCRERRAFEAACAEQRAYLEQVTQDVSQRQGERPLQETPMPQEGETLSQLERRSQELDCYARYLLRCKQQLQVATPPDPAATRDTVHDNVPRSVYVERDNALEQATQAKEEQARLQRELDLAMMLLHQREAELASVRAEESLSRARAQAESRHSQIANLRRIRDRLAERCASE